MIIVHMIKNMNIIEVGQCRETRPGMRYKATPYAVYTRDAE